MFDKLKINAMKLMDILVHEYYLLMEKFIALFMKFIIDSYNLYYITIQIYNLKNLFMSQV